MDNRSLLIKDEMCEPGGAEAAGLPSHLRIREQHRKLVVKAPKRKMANQSPSMTNTVLQSPKKGLSGHRLLPEEGNPVNENLIERREITAVVETAKQNSEDRSPDDDEKIVLRTTRSTSRRHQKAKCNEVTDGGKADLQVTRRTEKRSTKVPLYQQQNKTDVHDTQGVALRATRSRSQKTDKLNLDKDSVTLGSKGVVSHATLVEEDSPASNTRRKATSKTQLAKKDGSPGPGGNVTRKGTLDLTAVSQQEGTQSAPRRITRARATKAQSHRAANENNDAPLQKCGTSQRQGGHGRNMKTVKANNKEVITQKMQPSAKGKQTFSEEDKGEDPAVSYAITAGTGTLKRKMKARKAVKALAGATTDDCFSLGNALLKSKKPIPDILILPVAEIDEESNLSDMHTPSMSSLLKSTPHTTLQSTSSISSSDLVEADKLMFPMEVEGRKRKGPVYTSTPFVPTKKDRLHSFFGLLNDAEQKMRLLEEKKNFEDSDPEPDYFSDADA
ncbi:uncharacterized protein LOC135397067 [Ornithodoros turicata]|uniref:uncharacterized protein LOC135397067 n=1 Tax=Ornithodoros turicata TaxID=34597 RepID=UPI0031387F57